MPVQVLGSSHTQRRQQTQAAVSCLPAACCNPLRQLAYVASLMSHQHFHTASCHCTLPLAALQEASLWRTLSPCSWRWRNTSASSQRCDGIWVDAQLCVAQLRCLPNICKQGAVAARLILPEHAHMCYDRRRRPALPAVQPVQRAPPPARAGLVARKVMARWHGWAAELQISAAATCR